MSRSESCCKRTYKTFKWMTMFIMLKDFRVIAFRASDRSRKKKSHFAGFLGTDSRKNRPISREFRGSFRSKLHLKAIGNMLYRHVFDKISTEFRGFRGFTWISRLRDRTKYVGWLHEILFLVLSLALRGFSVFRFSPLLKNQHFQILIRSGTHRHVSTSS